MYIYFTAIVLTIIFLIFLIISMKLVFQVSQPKIEDFNTTFNIEAAKGYLDIYQYNNYNKENILVKSFDEYELNGEIIYNENNQFEQFVIFTHGFTYSRYGSIKYIKMFLKKGYNVVIYDLRNHGLNQRTFTSMGKNESKDLVEVIKYIKERFNNPIIGLHGESLGASTSLMALELYTDIDFVIADCGYSNLKELLCYQLKHNFKLPYYFINIANILNRIIYKYNFNDILPINIVKNSSVPILFIHGDSDNFTPKKMSEDMHGINPNNEIYIAKNSDHASSFSSDPHKYEEVVIEFLNKVNRVERN